MTKRRILLNIVILFSLAFSLYGLSVYGPLLRGTFYGLLGNADVKGAATVRANSLPDALQKDIAAQVDSLKASGMKLTVGQIMETLSRAKKIPQDAQFVHELVKEQLRKLADTK